MRNTTRPKNYSLSNLEYYLKELKVNFAYETKCKTILNIILLALLITCCKKKSSSEVESLKVEMRLNNFNSVNYKNDNDDLKNYASNLDYFELNVDLNKDSVLDKVFSHKEYMGNELIFFINENDHFKLALKSINFTEDGGRIIKSIEPVKNKNTILKINTYFPDGETNAASYLIEFLDDWYLSKTIYTISNWKENLLQYQICNINQNILLKSLNDVKNQRKVKNLPIDSERDRFCTNLSLLPKSIKELEQIVEAEKIESLSDIRYYKDLCKKFPISKSNVSSYNNIAYFLEKKGLSTQSIFLLEKIIKKFPNRTVAYINLGDAYWGTGQKDEAKEAYKKYVSQMNQKGFSTKIPERISNRLR